MMSGWDFSGMEHPSKGLRTVPLQPPWRNEVQGGTPDVTAALNRPAANLDE